MGSDSDWSLPNPLPGGGAARTGGEASETTTVVSVPSGRGAAQRVLPTTLSDAVEVEHHERGCLVDLSVPGAANPTVCPVKAAFASGAGLSTISSSIVPRLQAAFPEVCVVEAMCQEHTLRLVDGREVVVTAKTCPVRVAVHTGGGPVVLSPQRLAVMPGTEDVLVLGSPALKRMGYDVYAMLEKRAMAVHEGRAKCMEPPDSGVSIYHGEHAEEHKS